MATNLKLKKKCHIVPPDWLNVGTITRYIILLRIVIEAAVEQTFYRID